MKSIIRITALNLVLGLLLLTVSCKSYRNVEKLKPFMERNQEGYYVAESEFEKINKDEKILIELTEGKKIYMYYGSFSEKTLFGKVWKDERLPGSIEPYELTVPLEKIKNVRVFRSNPALTIGIPLGILGVTGLIILIAIINDPIPGI